MSETYKRQFYDREYIIWESNQICLFTVAKLKRKEGYIIWRDNNFSYKPVHNSVYEQILKKFINKRMKYIKENAEQKKYPCEIIKKALTLIKRKKYNN